MVTVPRALSGQGAENLTLRYWPAFSVKRPGTPASRSSLTGTGGCSALVTVTSSVSGTLTGSAFVSSSE